MLVKHQTEMLSRCSAFADKSRNAFYVERKNQFTLTQSGNNLLQAHMIKIRTRIQVNSLSRLSFQEV